MDLWQACPGAAGEQVVTLQPEKAEQPWAWGSSSPVWSGWGPRERSGVRVLRPSRAGSVRMSRPPRAMGKREEGTWELHMEVCCFRDLLPEFLLGSPSPACHCGGLRLSFLPASSWGFVAAESHLLSSFSAGMSH